MVDRKTKGKTGPPPRLTKSIAKKIEKDWIDTQDLDDRLPSVRKLATQYEVSQRTILSAMDQLQNEFKISVKVGSGAFVTRNAANKLYTFEGRALGVSFAKLGQPIYLPYRVALLEGLADPMVPAGLNIHTNTKDYRFYTTVEPKAHFDWPNVLGLFLIEQHAPKVLASLRSLNKPLISVDHDAVPDGVTSCCFDNHAAGAFLARRLIKLGHRRVGMLFEAPDKPEEKKDSAWEHRRKGFVDVYLKNRLKDPVHVTLGNRESLAAHTINMLKKHLALPPAKRCTAFFVPGPGYADALREIAQARGLQIPRDLTLVTCADVDSASSWTGFRFDFKALGLCAGNRMLAHLSGEKLLLERPESIRVKGTCFAGDSHGRILT